MGLALFVRANVNDCPRFAAVYDDCDLGVQTLPLGFCTPILTLVERVGALLRTCQEGLSEI